jgi:hypothetical protein
MACFDRNFDPNQVLAAAEPLHMDLVSGIFLMKTWMFRKHRITFYQATQATNSEDEGAVRGMMRHEIERWLHPKVKVRHIMCTQWLDDYKKETGSSGLDLPIDSLLNKDVVECLAEDGDDNGILNTREEAALLKGE